METFLSPSGLKCFIYTNGRIMNNECVNLFDTLLSQKQFYTTNKFSDSHLAEIAWTQPNWCSHLCLCHQYPESHQHIVSTPPDFLSSAPLFFLHGHARDPHLTKEWQIIIILIINCQLHSLYFSPKS